MSLNLLINLSLQRHSLTMAVQPWRAFLDTWWTACSPWWLPRRTLFINHGSTTTSHICFETCTGYGSLNAFSFDWPYKFTVIDITWHRCNSPMICTGLTSRKHSGDCDLAPVKGSSYREPDYAQTHHRRPGIRSCSLARVEQSSARCHFCQLTPVFQKTTENFSF